MIGRHTSERRKELAEGKTSKVALDDCNLPSLSSRGRVPAYPSSLSLSKLVARRRRVFKGTINSFVVTGLDHGTRAGFRSFCAGESSGIMAMTDQRIHCRLNRSPNSYFHTEQLLLSINLLFCTYFHLSELLSLHRDTMPAGHVAKQSIILSTFVRVYMPVSVCSRNNYW